jgi:hypothetical protein
MFSQGTFFGKPYAIFDSEDMKTSLGLYKQQSNPDGTQMFHRIPINKTDEKGNQIVIETKIPVLDATKTSVTLPPGLLHAGVVSVALGEAIKEFLATKSQAEKIALRNNPKIKVVVDRLEAEKLAKKGGGIDSDALLDDLDI